MAKIHFLNVDEGDCSIIQHDNGKVTMIDICCGNIVERQPSVDAFSNESANSIRGNFNMKAYPTNPVEYIKRWRISSIFRYIQTHPDMDHMDGLKNLADSMPILNFWDTENTKKQSFNEFGKCGRYEQEDWDCYQRLRKSANNPKSLIFYDGAVEKYFAEDDNGVLSDDYLKILSPTKELIKAAESANDWNDSSYVILYCIHGRKILFCGDAGMETINHLLEKHTADISNLDVLIAPHHGRDSDKDFTFLDVMNPKLTLVGNAKSEHLAYEKWNSRGLKHIQNNQGGNILIDIHDNGELHVSCSNKSFADVYNQEKFKIEKALEDVNNPGYWCLFYYKSK
ncbi:MAG: hypothetical protein K6E54_00400 [Bacteroidaceae bacterium]|nr:hypothetical protein [Bacteroidaceae bacterium]